MFDFGELLSSLTTSGHMSTFYCCSIRFIRHINIVFVVVFHFFSYHIWGEKINYYFSKKIFYFSDEKNIFSITIISKKISKKFRKKSTQKVIFSDTKNFTNYKISSKKFQKNFVKNQLKKIIFSDTKNSTNYKISSKNISIKFQNSIQKIFPMVKSNYKVKNLIMKLKNLIVKSCKFIEWVDKGFNVLFQLYIALFQPFILFFPVLAIQ